jgi:hypothetical protein
MPRTTTVHLLTGDYADRLAAIGETAKAALEDNTPLALAEVHPYEALKADYDDLKAEALEAATTVELTAIGRKKWRELKEKHPPRKGEDVDSDTARGDRLAGVNTDSVEDDLVYASLTAPTFKSRDAFDEWADERSEGEWQVLVTRAWELANGARLDPKELPPLPTRSDD